MYEPTHFDANCRQCPRLALFLDEVKADHPDYYCKPVPPFGADQIRLLIVGLAPGMHGANKTGRPFTGDHAGILLYETLYQVGLASIPVSVSADDDLRLINCRITNAVKCLPPGNKPTTAEIVQCNHYLASEMDSLDTGAVILALGKIAHDAVLRAQGLKLSGFKFAHGAKHQLPDGRILIDSYHCSRYNTQTRRLTAKMFQAVFNQIKTLLDI
jgi:uracil-DNA glycosylase family 4